MNYTKAVLYGFGAWVIPLVVAMLIFSTQSQRRSVFESLMPVAAARVVK